MTPLPVAVVGVGHLGKEHARILSSLPDVELIGVVDLNRSQAEAVAERCGTVAYSDHGAVLERVKAAVIAAPTAHHHAVARDFLERGISLLVEKPLTSTAAQGRDLVTQSKRSGAVLQVGHIERFNPAFEELQTLNLTPRYITAERCGGFTGRSTDVGVVLDLMIHDLDLVLALVRSPVVRVEAIGAAVLGGHEDMAQARVMFANGCIADLKASRVHPEPIRRMQVWGAEGYAGVDFAKRTLSLVQPGDLVRRGGLDSRKLDAGTVNSLKMELFNRFLQTQSVDCSQRHKADQLTRELEEFIHCVRDQRSPRADGQAGLYAVSLAGQVLDSLARHSWLGHQGGFVGPRQVPPPQGWLFPPASDRGAA